MVNPAGQVVAVDPSNGVEQDWGTLPQHVTHPFKQSHGGFEAIGGLIAQHRPSTTVFHDPRTLKPRFQLDLSAGGYHDDLRALKAGLLVLERPGSDSPVGPRLSLIDPQDGRPIWTARVPYRADYVAVRDLVVLHDGERLVAWRASDGTEAWAVSSPRGQLLASGSRLAIQRGGVLEFFDLDTGAPQSRKIRIHRSVVGGAVPAVVGDDAVYVASQDPTTAHGLAVLTAFDFDGQLRWQAELPTLNPSSTAKLLLAGGRVFVPGQARGSGLVLSGFDEQTGKKDFEWWMVGPGEFFVLRGGEGELLMASAFARSTLAFDPSQSIALHHVRASGKVVHAAGSLTRGELSRAQVCLGQKCAPVRPSGAYVIELEARGQVPLLLLPGRFFSEPALPPPSSPDMSPCARDVERSLDFEVRTHWIQDLPLHVGYCPNFEY